MLEASEKKLQDFVSARGLKQSKTRWTIAKLVLKSGGHLDAQAIVDLIREQNPEIGAATVYRNLSLFCDAEILKESLTDQNGRVLYELHEEGHHDHIVCTDCGQIFEFQSEKIESLQRAITKKMGFDEIKHRHVVYASCRFLK